jgi:hypothetical protein
LPFATPLACGPGTALDRDGATLVDLLVDNDKIAAIEPASGLAFACRPLISTDANVAPTQPVRR